MLTTPTKTVPNSEWPHHKIWDRVNTLFYSLPTHFETDLVIKGINVTEVFSLGSAFSSVVDSQVVNILNGLRNYWDPENTYSKYAFVRQSQTFPDVLLRNEQNEAEVLFGVELKSWYALSKEGEPSFRYKITPEACADADLLVVMPWLLSDVISGTPRLLRPYVESARYVAEYRNQYWIQARAESNRDATIRNPPESNRHPYPRSKEEASDEALDDKGNNFGRVARTGLLDEYLTGIKAQDYLGVKITHWIAFFKAITENSTDTKISKRLEQIQKKIQAEKSPSARQRTFLQLLESTEQLWRELL